MYNGIYLGKNKMGKKPEVKSLKDVYLQWRKVKLAGQKMAEDPQCFYLCLKSGHLGKRYTIYDHT